MTIQNSLENDLKNSFSSKLYSSNASISRLLEVHPSELPICPIRFVYEWIESTHNLMTISQLRDAITLNIGTTVHKCIQQFLPIEAGSRMVGDWVCTKCGYIHSCCIKPEKCTVCSNTNFEYEELPIKYKGFSGHIDTVYKTEEGLAIVDYKTATLDNFKEKSIRPSLGYRMQIRSYALLLKLQYKLVCTDVFLVFIAKEKPAYNNIALYHEVITPQKLHDTFLFLQHQRNIKQQLLSIKTFDEFIKLDLEPCANPYCKACKDYKKSIEYIKEHWNSELFPIRDYIQRKINGISLQSN